MALLKTKGLIVGVVGATGMVGRELLSLLERRRFPVAELLPFSSGLRRTKVRFKGRLLAVHSADRSSLERCDAIFFVSSDAVSASLAPGLARRGIWCLDDSSAFRPAPDVPLVIPEINASSLSPDRRLVAGPNCTVTGLAVAGYPLHRLAGVRRVRLASYQAVSGAGKAALDEFLVQARALASSLKLGDGPAPIPVNKKARFLPAPIACNVIPQVGAFDSFGRSSEESKISSELNKLWGADVSVSATTVRVPVVRGHSLAVWLEFERPLSPSRARRLLAKAPGVSLFDSGYPTPLQAGGKDGVFVGRLRQGVDSRELCLWIVSDNLLKGAALNSIQTAEELLRRGWLSPRGFSV